MPVSGRLIVTLAYKASGVIPKVLYIGYDADEAKAALEAARDKGFFEIRLCRNIDAVWISRFKADPVPAFRV
jgi:hypothetical protein